ncbi:MAG: TlpA disulfide reductase family protein [Planctomycetota bacterium]
MIRAPSKTETKSRFPSRSAAERYRLRAGRAIVEAADQVLAGRAADRHKAAALEMKFQALKVLDGLGDSAARGAAERLAVELQSDANAAVALTALRLCLADRLPAWRTLPETQKAATLDGVAGLVVSHPPSVDQLTLLTDLADKLGDTPDRGRVLRAVEPLLPRFEPLARAGRGAVATGGGSGGGAAAEKLAALRGVLRRLRLPGEPIEVDGRLLSGEPVDWAGYRGKVVLIDFWAAWCGLCHAELPNLQRLHKAYAGRGFAVLGVCLDEDPRRAEAFLARHGVGWATLLPGDEDQRGWRHPMARRYGVRDLPRAILVGRDGRVIDTNARGEALEGQLARLLGAQEPPPPGGQAASGVAESDAAPATAATRVGGG